MNKFSVCYALVTVATVFPTPSPADVITANGAFEFLDRRSSNDAGLAAGTFVQFGVNSVVPNGQATPPTLGTATRSGLANPLPLPNLNEGVNSNLFTTAVADSAANRGAWTLNFTNGGNTASATTPSISTSLSPLPFVTGVSVSGTGLNPTINWTNTAWGTPSSFDAVAIRIRDNGVTAALNGGNFSASVLSLNYFAPTTTSVSLSQLSLGQLTAGHEYSIEIDQVTLRTAFDAKNSTGFDFVNTLNQSRAFFDYSASSNSLPGQSIFLPTVGTQPNGLPAYTFQIQNVAANTPVFIDPKIAIGYSYKIGLGDPNFASVVLPSIGGTSSYTIRLADGETFTVLPGQDFDFTKIFANGVSSFEVLGINPDSALSPFDPNAFVTELTFTGNGQFTGEMDPITAAVPESSTWAMMILGFLGIGLMAYRRRQTPLQLA
jgi:hypothetical protein